MISETMKNLTRVAENFFEELENAFVSLSAKNPPSHRDNSKFATELFKNKLLTLEKMLTGKDALINFLLQEKVHVAKKPRFT